MVEHGHPGFPILPIGNDVIFDPIPPTTGGGPPPPPPPPPGTIPPFSNIHPALIMLDPTHGNDTVYPPLPPGMPAMPGFPGGLSPGFAAFASREKPQFQDPALTGYVDTFANTMIETCWSTKLTSDAWAENSATGLQCVDKVGVAPLAELLIYEGRFVNQSIEYTFNATTNANVGVIVRGQANLSGYTVRAPVAGRIQLFRVDANVETLLGQVVTVPVAGDRIRLEVIGGALQVYLNDVSVIVAADANYANGFCGVFSGATMTGIAKVTIVPL